MIQICGRVRIFVSCHPALLNTNTRVYFLLNVLLLISCSLPGILAGHAAPTDQPKQYWYSDTLLGDNLVNPVRQSTHGQLMWQPVYKLFNSHHPRVNRIIQVSSPLAKQSLLSVADIPSSNHNDKTAWNLPCSHFTQGIEIFEPSQNFIKNPARRTDDQFFLGDGNFLLIQLFP